MATRTNRTVICSVVFLDIVEYSRKPVAAQIRLKERLNDLLSAALAEIAVNDRIILDTGDGAAISFLGDPEDALFVSMALRDALAGPQPAGNADLLMRIGVNLGPVKLITDLNGQPNIIGDGINVAQRVMSFAEPGQILVSRSYYEVISCMSEEHIKLFQYEGARTDKHVREHEVYAVGASHAGVKRVSASTRTRPEASLGAARRAVGGQLSKSTAAVHQQLRRKPRLATWLAVGLILAASVGIRVHLERGRAAEPATDVAAQMGGPAPAAAAPDLGAPGVASLDAAAPEPPAATEAEPATAPKPAAGAAPKAPVRAAANAPPPAPAIPAPEPTTRPPPPAVLEALDAPQTPLPEPAPGSAPGPAAPETAKLRFAISPWGEVFVDGRKVGVAPPMRELEVEPGRRRIQVRNSTFPAHEQVVDAKAGQEIRITHKFR